MAEKNSTPPNSQSNLPQPIAFVRSSRSVSQNIRNILILIEREYKSRVYNRGFWIITAILVALVVVVAFAPTLIEVFSAQAQTGIVVVNKAGTLAGQDLVTELDTDLNISYDTAGKPTPLAKPLFVVTAAPAETLDDLRQKVSEGKLANLLLIERTPENNLHFFYYTNENPISPTSFQVRSVADKLNVKDKLARRGITPAEQVSIFDTTQFETVSAIQNGRSPAETNAALLMVFAALALLSTAITIYGASVGVAVAEEKSSRVMEILINAATPFQLMVGKIVGIGLAGLTQLGSMSAIGSLAALAQGPLKTALLGPIIGGTQIDITGFLVVLLGLLVVYFLLGFLLYATLYAAIGALVQRQEEVGPAGSVLGTLLMGGYFASWYAILSPQADWVVVGSYIPFFTPTLMLVRLSAGTVAGWEIGLSVLVMLVSIAACAWIAASIYRVGVLMYGQKPDLAKVMQILRSAIS